MNVSISLRHRDLAVLRVTGNTTRSEAIDDDSRPHQVCLGAGYEIAAYVTAADAQEIAAAWLSLAVELADRESALTGQDVA